MSPAPHESQPLSGGKPPSSSAGCSAGLLAGGLFLLFVAIAGLGLWGLGRVLKLDMRSSGIASDSLLAHWETPAERQAAIARALSSDDVGASAGELREFNRLFNRVIAARGDDEAFRKLVDIESFAERLRSHPVQKSAPLYLNLSLEADLKTQIYSPGLWSRFRILHVIRGKRPDEALVYVLLADHSDSTSLERWWLRRERRSWKVCDWEPFDLGMSEAAHWAMVRMLSSSPLGDGYFRVSDATTKANAHPDAAPAILKPLDTVALPASLHDHCKLRLAYAWQKVGRHKEAMAVAALIKRPDETPGKHHVDAIAYLDAEDFAAAIAAADRYVRVAGPEPEVLEIKAQSLHELDRQAEAVKVRLEMARIDPDDQSGLPALAQLLDDSQKGQLVAAIQRSSKPLEAASTLASRLISEGDDAGVAALEKYITGKAPQSPLLESLQAERLENAGKLAEAGEIYLRLLHSSTKAIERSQFRHRYLSAMCEAGKVVDAYQALATTNEEADELFHELLSELDEEEESLMPLEDAPKLLEAHRNRRPDDPWQHYYAGKMFSRNTNDAAAEREFAKAEKKTRDEDLRTMIRDERVMALARLGRWEEAYAAYVNSPDSEVFQTLANTLRGVRKFDDLRQLVERHAASHATDPWLPYYRAIELMERGEFSQAAFRLEGISTGEHYWLDWQIQRLKADVYLKAGDVGQAYRANPDRKASFQMIANQLLDKEQHDHFSELVNEHRAAYPNDPEIITWEVEAAWRGQKWDRVAELLTPWPAEMVESLPPQSIAELRERLVRSLLRIDRVDLAKAVAAQAAADNDRLPLLLVHLAEGDSKRAKDLLANKRFARTTFDNGELALDRELSILLTGSDYADVRERFPVKLPRTSAKEAEVILLLKSPVRLSPAELAGRLKSAGIDGAEVQTQEIESTKLSRSSCIVQLPGGLVVVTFCTLADIEDDTTSGPGLLDVKLQQAIQTHQGRIAFHWESMSNTAATRESKRSLYELAAALCDEGVLAVSATATRRAAILPYDNLVRERLQSGDLLTSVTSEESMWLLDEAFLAANSRRREQQQQMREISSAFKEQNSKLQVAVTFERGEAREEVWLGVYRLERNAYGGRVLHARLQGDSALWTEYKAGLPLEVEQHEVTEWKLPEAP